MINHSSRAARLQFFLPPGGSIVPRFVARERLNGKLSGNDDGVFNVTAEHLQKKQKNNKKNVSLTAILITRKAQINTAAMRLRHCSLSIC